MNSAFSFHSKWTSSLLSVLFKRLFLYFSIRLYYGFNFSLNFHAGAVKLGGTNFWTSGSNIIFSNYNFTIDFGCGVCFIYTLLRIYLLIVLIGNFFFWAIVLIGEWNFFILILVAPHFLMNSKYYSDPSLGAIFLNSVL